MQKLLRRLSFHYWYFRQPPWDTGISPPELFEFIQSQPAGRAIDLGCGTGTNLITLARAGWNVSGVDFAPRAIHLARRKLKSAGVQAELSVKDATKLRGIRGPFDLALDIGCFHSLAQNDQAKYLEQLNRILAPGGQWLMYGFCRADSDHTGKGLLEVDIRRITSQLTLVSRRDGHDSTRSRSSAWFLFQKHP
ncbi:MAG TPA: methyltransferase domain-containing protein [Anaerolineales bacterium]|nr:methyltransferase domain-containing protein [Anaerolineales bacterium]